MSDRLSGVLGNERLKLALGPLVLEKSAAGAAEQSGELGPGIRRTHVDDADRLDTRPRRLCINEVGSFAGLDAPPELLFCRHQNGQIERVRGDRDLHPFAAPSDDGQYRGPGMS